MIVNEQMEQGSEAWFQVRRGRPTASRFSDIITAKTGKVSASAPRYMEELVAECFCPTWASFIGNKFTDRGNEMEPEARVDFERVTGLTVEQVGFCTRDDGIVGCSPDGLIRGAGGGWNAGLELKCPAPKTHVSYMMAGDLPDVYKQQVHGGMAVTGLDEWHFYSYFPGMRPVHVLVKRDAYTEKLSNALDAFLIDYQKFRSSVVPMLQVPDESAGREEVL